MNCKICSKPIEKVGRDHLGIRWESNEPLFGFSVYCEECYQKMMREE